MRVKADVTSPGGNDEGDGNTTSKSSSSLGKLLNLITGDMENLERGKDFLEICQ